MVCSWDTRQCYFVMSRLIVSSAIRTTLELHPDFLWLFSFCSCTVIFLLLDSVHVPVGSSIRIVFRYCSVDGLHHIMSTRSVLRCIDARVNSLVPFDTYIHTYILYYLSP